MTPERRAERMTRIGGSDVGKITSGLWLELFLEKTGRSEPEDLTWVLPVQIGVVTEELNLRFFEHATGHQVFGRGEVYIYPGRQYIGVTIDGLTMIEGKPAVVECKHVNAFSKIEEIERRYYGQCAHSMLCTGASVAFLSVIIGTQRHEIIEIHRSEDYLAQLLELETAFWSYVERDEPPPQQEPLVTPARPDALRIVDMTGNNLWASLAGDWLASLAQAQVCERAARALRRLVEPDVAEATGAGISIKRSRDGKLLLREAPNGPTGEI